MSTRQKWFKFFRRFYYIWFRRDYIKASIAKRKGKCNVCGCCNRTQYIFGRWKIVCRYHENGKCRLWKDKGWDALPYFCKIYPFDEEDKDPVASPDCGFYWEK